MDKIYEDLLNDYRTELNEARTEGLKWWAELERAATLSDPATAEAQVRRRWPAGPVSYPRVIAVYRKYFLLCELINEKRDDEEGASDEGDDPSVGWGEDDEDDPEASTIPPPALLLGAMTEVDPELGAFMESFVFAPIGIDRDGRTA